MDVARRRLDQAFEMWARWVHHGHLVAGYRSLTGVMMENKGQMNFGSGGKQPVIDCVELRIETALCQLVPTKPRAVDVVRVEYGAWRIPSLPLDAKRIDKAHKMNISLATYERDLALARAHVRNAINRG
ncbi:hypothetical protein K6Y31_20540 [Motilimonas cestriensis]|uniref:Uncharacterized protein n=1 Tax=Motilimonas cestriensis TaxID=2742685 RepID=A0ABS8WDP2_9GAMM|nr:hypothetical protein [Motilimonas cestriensis]MCE2597166.1 hypothetical protein [Motilimonas cestriensis]